MNIKSLLSSILILCLSNGYAAHLREETTPLVNHLKTIEITHFVSEMKGIDCIYVINLDERPEKWKNTEQLFNTYRFRANRVSAVNGWQLSQNTLRDINGPYPIQLRGGEYGCLLSHLSVLKDAYDRGFNCIWICEDDIEFLEDPNQIPELLEKLSRIDPDWDIFYPDVLPRSLYNGYIAHTFSTAYSARPDQELEAPEYYGKKTPVDDEIMHIHRRTGTYAMFFSRKGIKKVLDYFTHVYLWSPIDVDLHFIPTLREYTARKDIVSNSLYAKSDTQEPIKTKEQKQHPAHQAFTEALALQKNEDFTGAIAHYKECITLKGDPTEVFWALYQIAFLEQLLNEDPDAYLASYLHVHYQFPKRAEPLYRLALYYRLREQHLVGYCLAKEGIDLVPPTDTPFLESWIYHWGLHTELALCAFHSGRYHEAKQIWQKMAQDTTLPFHVREGVLFNLTLVNRLL